MTTSYQDQVISDYMAKEFFDYNVDWTDLIKLISQHFDPEEVFLDTDLESWAERSDYFTKDQIFHKFDPDEIYDRATLQDWAENNGYVKDV